ncbi:class I SAM-dependent methyltransferase [Dactylosporangium matsuzakiense]|uniref:Methyltransferase n=1 Tax=Dactylosporangium matsuzakiense TaxID=53360 RepID=A0A9W6NJ04_9ACTN|nr:class I SAM-dependent methyltransferase [Dactylosporangium matsuzakiense]GLK98542.1 methyltransferase [Dactylosporangium matsuzakiense]
MDSVQVNRAHWDERASAHAASRGYNIQGFLDDPDYLSEVVRFDRPRLGDVRGLRTVHLQCHIGTDTLSLHRLGAQVTGLDFSPASLAEARELARRAGADIGYVEAEVYGALDVLEAGAFDLVYTGVGALCWLPDIRRWAETVSALLRPGGRLFIREGHPTMWAVDETRKDGLIALEFPYFERPDPLVWDEGGSYVDTDGVQFTNTVSHSFNHGLGEIVTALLGAGLDLTMLEEHDSCPWDFYPGATVEDEQGEHRLAERPERLPLTYTLQARKRSV